MRHFLYKTIIVSTPIVLVLVSVNFFGDAAKLFDRGYEKKMSAIFQSGRFITNLSNYDERIFQEELVKTMSTSPEVVVIGSSRSMLIDNNFFSDKTFFNNSVSGAGIQDLIAIYQIYKELNLKPKKLLLGVDPWMFNQNYQGNRWRSLEYYYNAFHSSENSAEQIEFGPFYKYSQLFSFSYFQISLRRLDDRISKKSEPIPTNKRFNEKNTKILDGSLKYGKGIRTASQKRVDSKIRKYIDGDIYGLVEFNSISESSFEEFKTLIQEIKKNDIEVDFFLSPYPPIAYQAIYERHPVIIELEEYINSYADMENIRVYGSYDPSTMGFDASDFYDGMHCKEKAIEEILGRSN